MSLWSGTHPSDLNDLFGFYHDFVKPLYGEVQSFNILPYETLFELNAALDHISRLYTYNESESDAVSKSYGHLKRCCLDIFKIKTKEAINQYNEIKKIDVSCIDNGQFEYQLHALAAAIRKGAAEARKLEGAPDADDSVPAFDLWCPVYGNCIKMEKDFFHNPHLNWAKKRGFLSLIKEQFLSFWVGCVTSTIVTFLTIPNHSLKSISILLWFDVIITALLFVLFELFEYLSKPQPSNK